MNHLIAAKKEKEKVKTKEKDKLSLAMALPQDAIASLHMELSIHIDAIGQSLIYDVPLHPLKSDL